MKKNRTMRVAALLLALTLMTSCFVGGTFAKYVTEGNANDSARVAWWGVNIVTTTGSDFAVQYATHETGIGAYTGAYTVQATEKVVAPGTSSEDVDGNVTFTITGTPEVATRIKIEVDATSEIKLEAGDYDNYVTADDTTDTFHLDEEYYPVRFTLTKDAGGSTTTLVDAGTLAAVASALRGESAEYDPGDTLDATYTLTWVWEFDGADTIDEADTYLGWENPAQKLGYTLKIRVEQID